MRWGSPSRGSWWAVCVLFVGCVSTSRPHPPVQRSPVVAGPVSEVAATLRRAFERRLTVWTRPDGTRVFVRHCRRAPAGGCRARIAALSHLIGEAAARHGVDPFLLAAMAIRESALDPSAVGAAGEAGILQLHPRSHGRQMRFVQDADYRRRCVQTRADACQRPVVEHAARALARAIERCGGVTRALGAYNTGRCAPKRRYARRVLDERERLLSLSGTGGGALARLD